MKKVLALVLGLGIVQLSFAQDEQQNLEDCPEVRLEEKHIMEDQTSQEFESQEFEVQAEEEFKLEEEAAIPQDTSTWMEDQAVGDEEIRIEDADVEIIIKGGQLQEPEADAGELETEAEIKTETEVQEGEVEQEFQYEQEEIEYNQELQQEGAMLEEDCPRSREGQNNSLAADIVEAPFEAVGEVGKGVGRGVITVVSETAEGVGHIVGAPFKGIYHAFGGEDDDTNL
ncbi:MAG TPA: hypothetical protein VIK89_03740 [Cytophagaceae bacterium]